MLKKELQFSGNSTKTSLIEINCETDFVAKNNDFILFAKEVSDINNSNSSNIEKIKNLICQMVNQWKKIQFH